MTDAAWNQAARDAAALPDGHELLRPDAARQLAVASHLAALNEKRHRMRLAWAEFFKDYDLLLCPVAVTAAFPHDHKDPRHERTIVVNNKQVPVVDQIFWAGYSGASPTCPPTAAPIGQTSDGLPIGVQIVGPQYGDYDLHPVRQAARQGISQLRAATRLSVDAPVVPTERSVVEGPVHVGRSCMNRSLHSASLPSRR